MYDKNKLLLLGGSRNMKEILDTAHDMGLTVGITDWYDTTRSPIKLLADEYFNVSINDDEAIDEIIQNNNYSGVLTGYTDSYLTTYENICQRNGFPCYGTFEQFKMLTDKSLYKKLFQEYGVPIIEEVKTEEVNEEFSKFPLILKPVDGSGGRGLEIVSDYSQFLSILDSFGSDEFDQKYIIEPYIQEREEMTAFFLFVDGECYVSGTANRFLSTTIGTKIGLPMFYSMPASYDSAFRKYTAPPMMRMFKDLGLTNGMLFAQCIIYDRKPCVYDVGYRLTGTLEYKLQEEMYGFNPLKMMINHAMTGQMTFKDIIFKEEKVINSSQYGFNVTILGKPGKIGSIQGEDLVRSIPGVIDIAFKMVKGEKIDENMIGTLGQIICRIFFVSDSIESSVKTLDKIYDSISVRDELGNDMIVDRMEVTRLLRAYDR